jgi:hypothetical protein
LSAITSQVIDSMTPAGDPGRAGLTEHPEIKGASMTANPVDSNSVDAPLAGAGDRGRLLRQSLLLDAVASGAMGVLLAAGSTFLDDPLGIPASVLVPVGGFLLAYTVGLWLLGSLPRPSHPAVRVVVAGNLLWVAASVVAVVAGWWSPTGAGTAFLLLQAAAVAVFAELQVTGLRRARSAAA